ncbi:cupin domain-containing protein, partial [Mycobacterium kansasii]
LAPNREIDIHLRADVDVLFQVLSGSGRLSTEERTVNVAPGDLIWLPRRLRRRQFTAGPNGLCYIMVHQ